MLVRRQNVRTTSYGSTPTGSMGLGLSYHELRPIGLTRDYSYSKPSGLMIALKVHGNLAQGIALGPIHPQHHFAL